MPYHNLNVKLTDQEKNELLNSLSEINQKLYFLINLSPKEIRRLLKFGDRTIPFIEKVIEIANQHPDLIPPYINLEELKNDFELALFLKNFSMFISQLNEKVTDTYLAVGSEAFKASLSIYESIKNASRLKYPGIESILSELSKRFEGQGKKKNISEG